MANHPNRGSAPDLTPYWPSTKLPDGATDAEIDAAEARDAGRETAMRGWLLALRSASSRRHQSDLALLNAEHTVRQAEIALAMAQTTLATARAALAAETERHQSRAPGLLDREDDARQMVEAARNAVIAACSERPNFWRIGPNSKIVSADGKTYLSDATNSTTVAVLRQWWSERQRS